jgi:DNA gyrase subunit B
VAHTLGLDLTPQMAELARTRLDEVRLGNVYSLPFSEGEFDVVVTREVLHILPRPALPLAEIFRVLKPKGQLIFGQTLPYGLDDAAWMWRIFKKKQPLIFNQFLEQDLVRLLQATGFVGMEMAEQCVWESIDVWINTHETSNLHREEIRRLYHDAPAAVRAVHPFTISPTGEIRDCWRWGIFSALKPPLREA